MNSEPLSESRPRRVNGSAARSSSTMRWMPAAPLPSTAPVSTQAVWISVRLSEWMNSPSAALPEWLTKSTSAKPGVVTAQASVLMGMWCFRRVPGLVRP